MAASKSKEPFQKLKLAAGAALVLLMAVYVGGQWSYYAPEPERPAFGPPGAGPGGAPPSGEEIRKRLTADLNLSEDQLRRMEPHFPSGPPSSFADMQKRISEMEQVLSPEQRTQLRSNIRSAMMARAAENLKRVPPEEREKFLKKLEQGPRGLPMMVPPPEGGRP